MSAPEPTHRFAIVLMARVPRPGRCKTRLCPPLSPEEAAELYRAFLVDIAREVRDWGLAADLWVAWWDEDAPEGDAPGTLVECLGVGYRLLRQRGASLTDRMGAVFADLSAVGYRWIILRNTDSPHLPRAHLEEAMEALEARAGRVVLGPDLDGGYCLIGLGGSADGLLPTQMSTNAVLEETVARARARGREAVLLEPFPDIDTPLDLATFWLEFAPRADVRHWESWKLLSEGDLIQRVQAVDEEGA